MRRILLGNHNQFANASTQNVFNPRDLFSANEQGLWLDPSDMTREKAGWRRNLLTYSEGTASQYGITSGISTASTPISGFANSVQFGDNSSLRYCYAGYTTIVGSQYTLSVYVQMDDNSVPSVGASATEGDFTLVALSNILSGVTVTQISGSLYRISKTVTGDGASKNFGIVKYTGQSAKTFRVTGYQLELGSLSEYQKITDFSTEFKAAFPTHTLYQDAVPSIGVTPCTMAGDQVGFIIDQSRGGLGNLGSELLVDTGFDNAASWTIGGGSPPSITGGQAVWNASTGNVSQTNRLVIGKWYRIQFDLVSYTSGTLNFRDGTTSVQLATTGATPGTKSIFFYATQTTAQFISFSAATLTIDNVSVKELPGNHAYQVTSAQRPTLARIPSCGRRNVLTYTEQLDNAAWTKNAVTVTANSSVAPDGTTTMDTVVNTTATDIHGVYFQTTTTAATTYTLSCYVKKNTLRYVSLGHWGGGGVNCGAGFDLDTGTVTGTGAIGTGYSATGASIQNVGGGIYRISVSVTQPTTVMYAALINRSTAYTSGSILESYAGQVTESTHVWGMQLELASSLTNYQKVVATTDVTESGFNDRWYLSFDGSDDSLVTNAVDFATWTQETRRNLFLSTESFGASDWAKLNATVTENSTTAPDGTITADSFIGSGVANAQRVSQTVTATGSHTFSIYAKANTHNFIQLFQNSDGEFYANFDLSDGTIGNKGTKTTASITSVGNGWYRLVVSWAIVTSGPHSMHLVDSKTAGYAANSATANSLYLWGAQLEAGTLTNYQRVGTDEMTVIAGVRKLSDAAVALLAEFSNAVASNNGSFWIGAPIGGGVGNYEFRSKGTTDQSATTSGSNYPAPITSVLGLSADISTPSVLLRVNGTQAAINTSTQGTGNYGNYQLFIGRRNQASFPYNGHLYQLIIRGKTTPTNQLISAEDYTKARTPIMAPIIISPPTISGTVELGQTLNATASYAHGNRPITTTWQWLRGATPISGATSSTYRIRVEDVGSTLTVVQTDTNFAGSYSAASAATVVVPAYTFASLFATNEQGVLYDLSEMTDAKTTWRRNLLRYSEQFDVTSSGWNPSQASVSANATTAPDGTLTADKLNANTNNSFHGLDSNFSAAVVSGATYTLSVYAKASEYNFLRLGLTSSVFGSVSCYFNLSNGTVGTRNGGVSASITSVGNGWYRCSFTATATASGNANQSWIYVSQSDNQTGYIGSATSGIFIWGAQFEIASSPTAYQPITDFSTEFKSAYPTHTLYQDSNGVTPVTQPGDPIGLVVDQRKGGFSSKTEISLTNGSFDSALTGWNASNSTANTAVSGQVTVTSASSLAYGFIQGTGANVMVSSDVRWYEIIVDCDLISGTGFIGAYTTTGVYSFFTDTGRKTRKMLVQGSVVEPRVGVTNSIGTSIIIYDIKIYQVHGNHAYQTSSGARPALVRYPVTGRRNLLTYSEQWDNAAWVKSVASVTANTHVAFDGTQTADTLEDTGSGGYGVVSQSFTYSAVPYTFSIDIRKTSGTPTSFPGIQCGPASVFHIIHTTNGTVSSTAGGQTCTVTSLDSNWWRVVVNFTPSAGADRVAIFPAISSDGTTLSTAAVGTVVVSRAQLELGSSPTTYQRVTSTYDVVEANQASCYGIQFDGSDDSLITNSVDFSGTDKVSLISGISKFVLSYTPEIVALSSNADINNGSFAMGSGENNSTNWLVSLRGNTALNSYSPRQYPSPTTNLVTALYDISQAVKANEITARINGVVDNGYSIGSESGGGNFGNYPLYLGRRGGIVLPFTGIIWNLVIRSSLTASNTLISTEELASENTPGVTL